MSFSAQIATSLFLAAAVVVAAPQGIPTVAVSSASFSRHTASGTPWRSVGRDWDSYDRAAGDDYDHGRDEDYSRLVRRGEYDASDNRPSRSTRRAARQSDYNRSSSVSSSDSDSGYAQGYTMRPAFSREVPSTAQLKYERDVVRRQAGYQRLQRRGRNDDSSSESDSYGQEYRESLRRRPSADYDSRLVRRGVRDRRRDRRQNDYSGDDSSSDSNAESYDNDNGYQAAPARMPYADDYYNGVAPRGGRRRERDYRLVRRDDYGSDAVQSGKGKGKKSAKGRRRDGDSDTSETDTSSESSSENYDTEDNSRSSDEKSKKGSGSENDDYPSGRDNDSQDEYGSDRGNQSDKDYESDRGNQSNGDYRPNTGNNAQTGYQDNHHAGYQAPQTDNYPAAQPDYQQPAQVDYANGGKDY